MLNKTGYGYTVNDKKINHLFYMNDLKLYGKNNDKSEELLKTVKAFSDDIGMEFWLDKCAKASFQRVKIVSSKNVVLDDDSLIKELDQA